MSLKNLKDRIENPAAEIKYNFANKTREDLSNFIAKLQRMEAGEIPFDRNFRKQFQLECFDFAFTSFTGRKGSCLHPSSAAKDVCKRKMYFDVSGVDADENYVDFTDDNQMQRLVDLGTLLHLYVQSNLLRHGVINDFEIPVNAPELLTHGSADGGKEFLLEIKTMTTHQFGLLQKFQSIEEFLSPGALEGLPDLKTKSRMKGLQETVRGNIKQASIYASVLEKKNILLLYYDKNTSALKQFTCDIDWVFVESYRETATYLRRLLVKNKLRKLPIFPERICKNALTKEAKECKYFNTCFE